MDILSEVLDTLHLQSTKAESIVLDTEHRHRPPSGQALAHVVISGACVLLTDSSPERMELFPMDSFLLLGGQDYALEELSTGAPAEYGGARLLRCEYSFDRDLPHPFSRRFPEVLGLQSHYLTDESELGRAVALLDGELVNARMGIDYVALRLAEIIFVEMLRRCQLEGIQPAFLAALSDPIVHGALERIHGEPDRPWQVTDLADAVGLSRAAFSERFHRHVGEPPLRYLRTWRLLKARRALQTTPAPIGDIAAQSGYRSSTGFSRAFQRLLGYPPSSLRRVPKESRTRTATSG